MLFLCKNTTMPETFATNTASFFNAAFKNLQLSAERNQQLQAIAHCIVGEIKNKNRVNLQFICTHNSRRSQLAQVWAAYAIHHFSLEHMASFSGGTAVTAFFRNTVETLQSVGFSFRLQNFSHKNPHYSITYKNAKKPIIAFSKLYDDTANTKPFIAITTCNNADENCPFIPEATERFHLPFTDPKKYDNHKNVAEKYLATNQQIAGEIYFLFKTMKEFSVS